MHVIGRRLRARRERGATLIEAAFVTPVVFLCLFGVIEIGVAMSSVSTTASASREGARYAAANFAVAAVKLDVAEEIADLVRRDLNSLTGLADPQVLWIYRADATTGDPILGAGFSSCNSSCYRFTWDGANDEWVYDTSSPGWALPDACVADGGIDTVGVYVQTRHHALTGFIDDRTIREHVNIRLEPLPSEQC